MKKMTLVGNLFLYYKYKQKTNNKCRLENE